MVNWKLTRQPDLEAHLATGSTCKNAAEEWASFRSSVQVKYASLQGASKAQSTNSSGVKKRIRTPDRMDFLIDFDV